MSAQLLTSLVATFGAYGLYKLITFFYGEWTSPIRILPGPPSPSWFYGNLKEIWQSEKSAVHEKWVKEHGPTITYKALFGKPEPSRYSLSRILGTGVLVVEGEQHKQQRRVMNPAFGALQVRELTEIFVDKSLRDIWMNEISKEGDKAKVDALSWLSRLTLDVIGLAGFSYQFNALSNDPEKNELNRAFAKIFNTNSQVSLSVIVPRLIPALRWIPVENDAETRQARQTMDRIGRELLDSSKAKLAKSGTVEKDSLRSKDLLTLLLRANMATDLPEHQRMSDEDVLAQVPTFLVAGHETTSTATTWALFALCDKLELQQKLREELLTVSTDNPTMDELNALPYLDAVVRETLRLHPPVVATMRAAIADDVIPLGVPFTDRNGKVHDSIQIREGQTILIPIAMVNRIESLWGPDAHEYRPERWLGKLPDAVSGIPNIWGNTLSFLAGPRACIGYRFSLVETKAILFTLLRAFEFELAVPVEDIGQKATIVQRPILRSDPKAGNQLPLYIRPVQRT
ncbi:cytochrome P450 [Coprinopsis cinerea okayama7|uniref:Cytochrome P450 n=1 Tax=Coprinopsis cinerea (strain Okayama-7 / 130 / ATCC MYA-4618 / FGSC 9003) TaxID=240176 RepID=A8P9S3_COPC7|nr:cytochrome P450 [Coprinopsis cinerea okayama7\|eukprot:XP_001839826.2 cytochrome P450 [Coprinopsis cinerea okayama7\